MCNPISGIVTTVLIAFIRSTTFKRVGPKHDRASCDNGSPIFVKNRLSLIIAMALAKNMSEYAILKRMNIRRVRKPEMNKQKQGHIKKQE